MFHRHSIKSRMYFILTLMLTLFAGMAYLSYNSTQIAKSIGTDSAAEQMLADQQAKIKVASHTIALAVGHAIEGVEQDAEKIEVIRNLISDIRFEADKSGYYFVYHDTTVVALPPKPSLQGKNLKGLKDKNGVHPIAELWEKAKKGGGFIQYVWPKPGAGDTPKLGYAEMIPGTKFWIGTGVYIDNVQIAQGEIASKIDGVVNQRLTISLIVCGVIFLLGIVPLTLMVTQSIVGPLRRIADGLNLGADQVASASGQVSDTGQVLAAGASEQASNIEETAASLEEMESTTMKNAENANESNSIVKESIHDIGTANQLMSQLTTSMQEISTASEETSKIIKTIDEIAFQTNLLALNAAVEAARAGEAGAGFAVVADEVRNLAMRSAEAAKNTSEIIQDTVEKVGQGSDILARTSESFSTVEGRSQKMAELVEEIAAASGEQARGIKQINSAVTQMDNVVQQNAANAEESASAAEELSAQAEQLKDMVNSLTKVVDGQNHGGKRVKSTPRPKRRRASAPAAMSTPRPAPVATEPTPAAAPVKEVSPEQLIPLDDDDFKDF